MSTDDARDQWLANRDVTEPGIEVRTQEIAIRFGDRDCEWRYGQVIRKCIRGAGPDTSNRLDANQNVLIRRRAMCRDEQLFTRRLGDGHELELATSRVIDVVTNAPLLAVRCPADEESWGSFAARLVDVQHASCVVVREERFDVGSH